MVNLAYLLYIQEGDHVNCHVTAPGAIVALGLMYLKTNDRYIHIYMYSREKKYMSIM